MQEINYSVPPKIASNINADVINKCLKIAGKYNGKVYGDYITQAMTPNNLKILDLYFDKQDDHDNFMLDVNNAVELQDNFIVNNESQKIQLRCAINSDEHVIFDLDTFKFDAGSESNFNVFDKTQASVELMMNLIHKKRITVLIKVIKNSRTTNVLERIERYINNGWHITVEGDVRKTRIQSTVDFIEVCDTISNLDKLLDTLDDDLYDLTASLSIKMIKIEQYDKKVSEIVEKYRKLYLSVIDVYNGVHKINQIEPGTR